MVHKKTILILFLLLLTRFLLGASTLIHTPPVNPVSDKPMIIEAVVFSDVMIIDVRVIHRSPGQTSFHEINMIPEGEGWKASIPSIFVTENGLEYSILVRLADGSALGFPSENPLNSPYFLPVIPEETSTRSFIGEEEEISYLEADILIVSPEEDRLISSIEALIVASLYNIQGVALNTVKIIFDGIDVTSLAVVTPEILIYTPENIEPGFHTVRIELKNLYGISIEPKTWSFTVSGREKRIITASEEFSYKGKVRSDYSLDKIERGVLSIGQTRFEFEGGWNWLNFVTDLRLTSNESEFLQPRNRYSLGIKSGENILINLGDFTPVLSPYTINGKRVRGFGVDVNLNWIRFQLVQGELERAIQGLPSADDSYIVTNISSDGSGKPIYELDRRGFTFSRQYQAYRLSLNLFNRARLGLNLQKARDDPGSVSKEVGNAKFTVPDWTDFVSDPGLDSGVYSLNEFKDAISDIASFKLANAHWGGDLPQDNIVFGFDAGLSFDERRLNFDLDWAVSFINKNIWDGALTKAEMDTTLDDSLDGFIFRTYDEYGLVTSLGFSLEQIVDPSTFKDFFIVNANMIPLVPVDIELYAESPISAILNMPSAAYKIRMQAYYYENTFQMQYSQVGPEFISLANPYFSRNLRQFFISDRIRLFDNKLSIRMAYKHRDNKILSAVVNPYSQNTVSSNFALAPGLGLPTFTFDLQSVRRSNGSTELDSLFYTSSTGRDSLVIRDFREDTKTSTTNLTISIPIRSGGVSYNFLGTFNIMDIEDQLMDLRRSDFISPNSGSQSFSLAVSTHHTSPLKTSFNITRYNLELPGRTVGSKEKPKESRILKFAFNGSYGFRGNKLRILGGLSYMKTTGISEFSYIGANTGIDLSIWKNFTGRGTVSGNIKQAKNEFRFGTLAVKISMNYLF